MLFAFLCLVAVLGAGWLYSVIGERRDRARYPPPGRLVEIGGGQRLHIHAVGEGSPVVVLEAGIAATSLSWALVQPEVAKLTAVCSYDRAGLGWSDATNSPRTPSSLARELHALLEGARLPGPYVLVGHSFGGLVVQRFGALYPADVSGLVLVDPLAASEWHPFGDEHRRRWSHGVRLSRRGALLARFGVVRACLAMVLAGGRFAPRFAGRLASGRGGSGFLDRIGGQVGKLPRAVWPLVAAHWCRPASFEGMARHLEALPESASEMSGLPPLNLPAIVITGGRNASAADPAPALSHARRIRAEGSGHWVQLDEPQVVIEAIREMVETVRREAELRRSSRSLQDKRQGP
jgi:pimeloyl-ACP methyl ester carboxylesterase